MQGPEKVGPLQDLIGAAFWLVRPEEAQAEADGRSMAKAPTAAEEPAWPELVQTPGRLHRELTKVQGQTQGQRLEEDESMGRKKGSGNNVEMSAHITFDGYLAWLGGSLGAGDVSGLLFLFRSVKPNRISL